MNKSIGNHLLSTSAQNIYDFIFISFLSFFFSVLFLQNSRQIRDALSRTDDPIISKNSTRLNKQTEIHQFIEISHRFYKASNRVSECVWCEHPNTRTYLSFRSPAQPYWYFVCSFLVGVWHVPCVREDVNASSNWIHKIILRYLSIAFACALGFPTKIKFETKQTRETSLTRTHCIA